MTVVVKITHLQIFTTKGQANVLLNVNSPKIACLPQNANMQQIFSQNVKMSKYIIKYTCCYSDWSMFWCPPGQIRVLSHNKLRVYWNDS